MGVGLQSLRKTLSIPTPLGWVFVSVPLATDASKGGVLSYGSRVKRAAFHSVISGGTS